MGVTCGSFYAFEPSASPGRPSKLIDLMRDDLVDTLLLDSETDHRSLIRRGDDGVTVGPLTAATVITVDEEGCFVVADIVGAVYGAGSSESEARGEFEAALVDHLRFLRARADQLHPRLRRQLAVLDRLFPDR